MSFAEFFTEHNILINACLYLFIEMGIIETQRQTVCPFLSYQADFSNHGFIMILVIKTFQMINLIFVKWRKTYASIFFNLKFAYISVYIIIIIREILKSIDLIHKTILERLSEAHV